MSSFTRPPTQEELNAPTDFEIAQITKDMPDVERERFTAAAVCLYFVKCQLGNRTPWRQLVRQQRLDDELVPVQIDLGYVDGRHVIETVYMDRNYPKPKHELKESDAMMLMVVRDLSDALKKIESFEPNKYVNQDVEVLLRRERQKVVGALGGRPEINREEIRACLNRSIEKHGAKKIMDRPISWIIDQVVYAWQESHATASRPPANNTIRAIIEEALPEHPVVKKKKSKKPGC